MGKEKKGGRVQARLPRGFADRGPGELLAQRQMLDAIRETYELYGFEPVETPAIEYTDALGKFLPDQDRPNEGVFSFQDDDEQWLSLRYDLTAPLARYVAQNFDALPKPYRSYRVGYVFRNEKPGPGRFRQFMQFDADTVGTGSITADAEICMMVADCMEKLGIKRGDYVVRVNNRKVLDGVLEAIGLGGDENVATRLTVLRAIDKLDRLGPEGVKQLLGKGRKDESGDFTKGAGLDEAQAQEVLRFVTAPPGIRQSGDPRIGAEPGELPARAQFGDEIVEFGVGNPATIDKLRNMFAENSSFQKGVDELRELSDFCQQAGYDYSRIRIDPSVVRGLEYYTGLVYEVELTFETVNEKGEKARFGSVAGGGRYDGLVGRFRGQDVPATGISIGVSRLQAALAALGRIANAAPLGPVVVLVMDEDVGASQAMAGELRDAGIRAEMYTGTSGMRAQMKYADRRNAPVVVIQGEDERKAGEVTIKDLFEGKRLSGEIEDRETWTSERPAQVTVPRGKLVEEVRHIVAAARGGS